MTDSDEWIWDDSAIPNHAVFLRRVPPKAFEDSAVVDYETNAREMGAGMFRYDAPDDAPEFEGMSCHSLDVLEKRGRTIENAYRRYPESRVAVFTAGAVRTLKQAGVHLLPDDEEPDEDLAAAHALVRTPEAVERPSKRGKHPLWNQARVAILEQAWWHHEHPERVKSA